MILIYKLIVIREEFLFPHLSQLTKFFLTRWRLQILSLYEGGPFIHQLLDSQF
jgi:hypothetical protein